MKRMFLLGLILCTIFAVHPAYADGLDLAPTTSFILPSDGSGQTKVVLKFDLAAIEEDSNVDLATATIDWPMAGLTAEQATTCNAYGITSAWSASGALSGEETPEADSAPAASWEMDALAYSRLGWFVRLDVKDLVKRWLVDPDGNFGMVVTFNNLTAEDLSGKYASPRLRVRYVRSVSLSQ